MEVQKKKALPSYAGKLNDDRAKSANTLLVSPKSSIDCTICILTQPAHPLKPGQVTADE